MGVPVCLTQEDLKAGKVDVAILGAPVDMSGGQRGAAYGPRYIRADERMLPHTPLLLQNPDTRIRPFEVLKVVDYGDAAVDPFSIEASMGPIRELVREVAETGALPFVLGGDHSILWPNAAAVADVYGAGNVGVIHFDTHVDCANQHLGHLVTHGTPIRRLIEDEHIPSRNFVQIGLHSFVVPDDQLLAWMRARGMRSHHMAEIDRIGFDAVLEKAIAEALDGPKYIYISLDIDVLDPAFAPGTGTQEPGGLTPRELLPAIRRVCHETPVVGFEVVEVAPPWTPATRPLCMPAGRFSKCSRASPSASWASRKRTISTRSCPERCRSRSRRHDGGRTAHRQLADRLRQWQRRASSASRRIGQCARSAPCRSAPSDTEPLRGFDGAVGGLGHLTVLKAITHREKSSDLRRPLADLDE